jgi:Xaa-Pro aminopeptidase
LSPHAQTNTCRCTRRSADRARHSEIKSPAEIAIINRATKIGGEAIIEAMRSTVPGLTEQELDAVGQFIFTRHGAQGEAYRAIVASGPVATNPHHRASPK